jgi:hypothetical protein
MPSIDAEERAGKQLVYQNNRNLWCYFCNSGEKKYPGEKNIKQE